MSSCCPDPLRYCELAAERGLIVRPVLKRYIRFVFYRGVTRADALAAADIVRALDAELGAQADA